MKRILVVDDEQNIRDIVAAYLVKDGYEVSIAKNGLEALELFDSEVIDLVVLDLMMPLMGGEEVCRRIREHSHVPIIMLTAKVSEDDAIKGIKGGADDYIRKPFSVRELMVRIHGIFRRLSIDETKQSTTKLGDEDVVIDFNKMTTTKRGNLITLTPNEYKILKVLVDNEEIVLTREQIIEKTFGVQFDGFDRTIDSHIKNLRQKLEDYPKKPIYIRTVYSVGYKLMTKA